ncbi:MAG: DedA family protein [Proteobacteria bacterium]|nr:DedA family protein [Pseudomonadota bacterium]
MLKAAESSHAFWICCLVSFAESSFFPLPPDLIMIPMGISNRKIVFKLALYLTIFSVVGGFLGYAIGYYLFSTMGSWIIESYNLQSAMDKFQADFAVYGFWIIALKGLTPIPYKLVTIASGVAQFDLLQFTIASIIARGFRFFLLASLLWFFGPMAKPYIEKYLGTVMTIILGTIILGFLALKLYYN